MSENSPGCGISLVMSAAPFWNTPLRTPIASNWGTHPLSSGTWTTCERAIIHHHNLLYQQRNGPRQGSNASHLTDARPRASTHQEQPLRLQCQPTTITVMRPYTGARDEDSTVTPPIAARSMREQSFIDHDQATSMLHRRSLEAANASRVLLSSPTTAREGEGRPELLQSTPKRQRGTVDLDKTPPRRTLHQQLLPAQHQPSPVVPNAGTRGRGRGMEAIPAPSHHMQRRSQRASANVSGESVGQGTTQQAPIQINQVRSVTKSRSDQDATVGSASVAGPDTYYLGCKSVASSQRTWYNGSRQQPSNKGGYTEGPGIGRGNGGRRKPA